MVKLLDLLCDTSASHEAILFFILLEKRRTILGRYWALAVVQVAIVLIPSIAGRDPCRLTVLAVVGHACHA